MSKWVRPGLVLVTLLFASRFSEATVPLYRNGSGLTLDLGVRVQIQYYHLGGDGWSEQKVFFRRLRPTLEAHLSDRWEAEAEFDFGETIEGEPVEFKDLFVTYLGLESKGFRFTVGNEKAVFSRQFQSSSKSLTLVDRGFVGIDDFGTLDRIVGARVEGHDSSKRVALSGSFGLASHEPGDFRMEFDSPLNAGEDANRGFVLGGRVDVEPLGEVEFDQGDFGSPQLRFVLSAAAYRWTNDGSENRYSGTGLSIGSGLADLDRSRGVELSGGLRGRGLSADAELHWIHGETVEPTYSGGIYERGEANLTKLSVQSGYLVFRDRLEVVGGFDRLNAATYSSSWKRIAMGGTVYFKRLKLQVNYLLHFAFFGVAGDNPRAIVTQLQLLF